MITAWHQLRWYWRWPIKWAVVAATFFLICFPDPFLFARHLRHWQDPNAMINPDLPALAPWVEEVRGLINPESSPKKALKTVEKFVYKKVPYEWDWNTWGSADYLPTLAEVIEKGREDCDGQAVAAASILKSLGYKAELVTDFAHVWVKTDKGETMHPGKKTSIAATEKGFSINWNAVVDTLPKSLAWSVAPFPLGRELILLVIAWLMLLRPNVSWRWRLVCFWVVLSGLLFLRAGGHSFRDPNVALQWWGIAHLVAGAVTLFVLGRRGNRQSCCIEGGSLEASRAPASTP